MGLCSVKVRDIISFLRRSLETRGTPPNFPFARGGAVGGRVFYWLEISLNNHWNFNSTDGRHAHRHKIIGGDGVCLNVL
jgi:hypothetical protein